MILLHIVKRLLLQVCSAFFVLLTTQSTECIYAEVTDTATTLFECISLTDKMRFKKKWKLLNTVCHRKINFFLLVSVASHANADWNLLYLCQVTIFSVFLIIRFDQGCGPKMTPSSVMISLLEYHQKWTNGSMKPVWLPDKRFYTKKCQSAMGKMWI